MQDLNRILSKFAEIVQPEFCNELAKKCQFVQRSSSQLQGYEFAQSMIIPNGFLESETLNSLATRMNRINPSCNLTASALSQRINKKSTHIFLKKLFEKVLKELIEVDLNSVTDIKNLSGFNRVLIEDSTQAELHENLSSKFKGSGGLASKSSVKIDYIFDYLGEQMVQINFCSGNIPDQSLSGDIISILEKDDLVIRDLGYFVIKKFEEIEEKGAYYISRWKVSEHVYSSKDSNEPLDLATFFNKNDCNGIVDVEVFIGKNRYPTRLLACQVSDEALQKRLRLAKKGATKRGTTISKKKKNLLKYTIFITNVPATILSAKSVMATYRARWRIELVFKEWKSCLKLHLFKGYNEDRFYCFMYGRLIMVILLGAIYPPLFRYGLMVKRELSGYKMVRYILSDNMLAIAIEKNRIDQFIEKLIDELPRRLCMQKRKRPSLREDIRLGNSYYNNINFNELDLGLA